MRGKKRRPTKQTNSKALNALMDEWPASWAGMGEDEEPGRRLVTQLRPFIEYLIDQGLSAKTVRRHLDYLWAIGGEVVRQFDAKPKLRQAAARDLLLQITELGEAPLLPDATEDEQRRADATARKLLKFLLSTKQN